MNHQTTTTRVASWKWWITCLLLLATTINYMDRMTLSSASVRITQELDLSNVEYGNLELAFGWAFAFGSLVFGILADRWRIYYLKPKNVNGAQFLSVDNLPSGDSDGFS